MNYKDLIYLIYSDLYRTTGKKSTIQLLKNVFFENMYIFKLKIKLLHINVYFNLRSKIYFFKNKLYIFLLIF